MGEKPVGPETGALGGVAAPRRVSPCKGGRVDGSLGTGQWVQGQRAPWEDQSRWVSWEALSSYGPDRETDELSAASGPRSREGPGSLGSAWSEGQTERQRGGERQRPPWVSLRIPQAPDRPDPGCGLLE